MATHPATSRGFSENAELKGVKKVKRKLTDEELRLLKETGYSKKAIELYLRKTNVGVVDDPDITETYVGPCGDVIKLYLKISRNDIVKEAKFHYLGCPGSAASASAMINLVKGKTIHVAKNITESDILNELGGLPKPKLDCPKLVITTLRKALVKYQKLKAQQRLERT
jgi:nitrogen fixation NifU-like protein